MRVRVRPEAKENERYRCSNYSVGPTSFLNVDNVSNVIPRETIEQHNLVDSVDKLWLQSLSDHFHHLRVRAGCQGGKCPGETLVLARAHQSTHDTSQTHLLFRIAAGHSCRQVGKMLCAKVARHDHKRISKVDAPSLAICEMAFI